MVEFVLINKIYLVTYHSSLSGATKYILQTDLRVTFWFLEPKKKHTLIVLIVSANTFQAGRFTFISSGSSFVTTATATCMSAMIFIRLQNYETIDFIELKTPPGYKFGQQNVKLNQTTNICDCA